MPSCAAAAARLLRVHRAAGFERARQALELRLQHEHLARQRDDHAHQARRLRVARAELAELRDEVGLFCHQSTLIFASAISLHATSRGPRAGTRPGPRAWSWTGSRPRPARRSRGRDLISAFTNSRVQAIQHRARHAGRPVHREPALRVVAGHARARRRSGMFRIGREPLGPGDRERAQLARLYVRHRRHVAEHERGSRPPMTSICRGAEPLYGTCTMSTLVGALEHLARQVREAGVAVGAVARLARVGA